MKNMTFVYKEKKEKEKKQPMSFTFENEEIIISR